MAEKMSAVSQPFDPASLGLPDDFLLTDYTRLKGCSCKIPQPKLLVLLEKIRRHNEVASAQAAGALEPTEAELQRAQLADVGMDCSIVPLKSKVAARLAGGRAEDELFMVSTTDFFFPSVEDPFLQGQIGCANVLSDLYAMGLYECDTLLMLLAASTDMEETDRYTVTLEMMKGFAATARQAETSVTGGQSVLNPWPLIGGVAMSVAARSEMIPPDGVQIGDIFVLTKPLGHQLAVNVRQWSRRPTPLYNKHLDGNMSEDEISELYQAAASNMARLNRNGAKLMMKYRAHGCTDVTGFGLLGHAGNLSEANKAADGGKGLTIEINLLPILKGAVKAEKLLNNRYKLFKGLSAETSGGLLIAFKDKPTAQAFQEELAQADAGTESWIVGQAVARKMMQPGDTDARFAEITPDATIVEV